MKVALYNSLNEIVKDLISVLKKPKHYIYKHSNEVEPYKYDLSFSPIISKKVVEQITHPNLCTLCNKRISYKTIPFQENSLTYKTLILIHNSFFNEKEKYFKDDNVNLLFKKIIKETLQLDIKDFLVREVLRCHFGSKDIHDSQWFNNCKQHILKDIEKYNIQSILIMGNSVRLLFKDNEEIKNRAYKVTSFLGLPCVISPGPEKIIYMQNNNFSKEKIIEEKKKIIRSLNIFKEHLL